MSRADYRYALQSGKLHGVVRGAIRHLQSGQFDLALRGLLEADAEITAQNALHEAQLASRKPERTAP